MNTKSETNESLNSFVLSGTSPPTPIKSSDVDKIANAITIALASIGKPCTEKQLLRLVKGRKQTKIPVLRSLVRDGKVSRSGGGKKGDPFLYILRAEQITTSSSSIVEEIVL